MDRGALDLLTVACVETGDYEGRGAAYVRRLAGGVRRWLPVAHRFVCFTDAPDRHPGIETAPVEPWPGWWAKLGLFRPGAISTSRALYVDLDTLILGDLSPLAALQVDFGILRDAYRPDRVCGGLMAWRVGFDGGVIEAAVHAAGLEMANPRVRDDLWLVARVPPTDVLQDRLPGFFRSYKVEGREGPGDAAVVFFHGRPRPHEAGGWAQAAWEAAA